MNMNIYIFAAKIIVLRKRAMVVAGVKFTRICPRSDNGGMDDLYSLYVGLNTLLVA